MPTQDPRSAGMPQRRGAPWRWILFLIFAVCVAWLIAHFAGKNAPAHAARPQNTGPSSSLSQDAASPQGGTGANSTSAQQGSTPVVEKGDVEKLVSSSQDAQRLVNRPVMLHDVKVLTVTPDKNFWAGFGGDDSIFVVQPRGKLVPRAAKVEHGDTVSINGVVQPAPQNPQQEQAWGLKSDDIQRLNNEKVYVQAKRVKKE